MKKHMADTLTCANGKELKITFFGHSSMMFEYDDHVIYNDPVSDEMCHYENCELPKADVILISHDHFDHFDGQMVGKLWQPSTVVVCNTIVDKVLKSQIGMQLHSLAMHNGDKAAITPYLYVQAVAAYNSTPGRDIYHPKGRDNGYIMTLGESNIYIAGDSENTPEMMSLHDIDIAFLPVNQPYTMTIAQAVEAARAIKPRILYPYHLTTTDIGKLQHDLSAIKDIEVRIRDMQ